MKVKREGGYLSPKEIQKPLFLSVELTPSGVFVMWCSGWVGYVWLGVDGVGRFDRRVGFGCCGGCSCCCGQDGKVYTFGSFHVVLDSDFIFFQTTSAATATTTTTTTTSTNTSAFLFVINLDRKTYLPSPTMKTGQTKKEN